jgi:hypothetical protein
LPGRNPHEILNDFLRASLVAQDHAKTLRIEASFGLRRMDTSARRTRSPPSPPVVATMASPARQPASSACVPVRPILRLPSQPSSARRPIRPSKPHTLPDRLGAVRVVEVEIPSPLRSPARKILLWCRSSPDTRSAPDTFPASVHTGGAAPDSDRKIPLLLWRGSADAPTTPTTNWLSKYRIVILVKVVGRPLVEGA